MAFLFFLIANAVLSMGNWFLFILNISFYFYWTVKKNKVLLANLPVGPSSFLKFFSAFVMEVQAVHFHSSPTHKGLQHLRRNINAVQFVVKNVFYHFYTAPAMPSGPTTNADRVPSSCRYRAHLHPPQSLHCPGLLLGEESSVSQLTMTVKKIK